ncbi:MAG: hypothetical protein Ct9H300mP21_11330 [Pseudomonadota bacterium]|nr:MAG: hypothetical protein Ct9H300mP21_11330 [Pseudomonadota bacterium]
MALQQRRLVMNLYGFKVDFAKYSQEIGGLVVNWRTNEPASKYHFFFNYNLRKAKYLMRYTTFVIFQYHLCC